MPQLSRLTRLVLALAVAVLILGTQTGTGFAHANLDRSEPADGATLASAPPEVRLWFTEDVEPAFSRAVVLDANRQGVSVASQVAANDSHLLIVALQPGLRSGWYSVFWQAQAKVDGHLTRGVIAFGVGVTGAPPGAVAAEQTAQTGSGSPTEVVLRWLIVLSATTVVGGFAFWTIQGWVIQHGPRLARPIRLLPLQWALAELAWIVFLLANVVFLTNAVANVVDAATLDDLGGPLVQLATRTTFGQLWLIRMGIAVALGIVLSYRGTRFPSRWDIGGAVLGGALLLSLGLVSHSASLPTMAPLAIANDWLHFTAAAVWVGGLLQLTVLLVGLAAQPALANARADYDREILRRFAALATYAVALVAVTGLGEAVLHLGTPISLVATRYGQVVLLKVVLLVPMVALGAAVRRRLRANLTWRKAVAHLSFGASTDDASRADPGLARTLVVESLWAAGLLAAVGWLTSLSPPS
jgi:copper transport protein